MLASNLGKSPALDFQVLGLEVWITMVSFKRKALKNSIQFRLQCVRAGEKKYKIDNVDGESSR